MILHQPPPYLFAGYSPTWYEGGLYFKAATMAKKEPKKNDNKGVETFAWRDLEKAVSQKMQSRKTSAPIWTQVLPSHTLIVRGVFS